MCLTVCLILVFWTSLFYGVVTDTSSSHFYVSLVAIVGAYQLHFESGTAFVSDVHGDFSALF